jgi:hypothetical protein
MSEGKEMKGWLQEIWAYVFGYSWLFFVRGRESSKKKGVLREKERRRICCNEGERKNHKILLNCATVNFQI